MAAAGAAAENRELVAEQLAAALGEDGREAAQTCSLLLAVAGRGPPDAAAVRCHATADWGVVASGRMKLLVVTTENSVPQNASARSGV